MRIGCLAWGSLVWDPGPLPLAGPWQRGGPLLPIEFSRVGDHHELATALTPGARPMPTRWAELRCRDVAEARERLREREGVPATSPQKIGSAAALQGAAAPVTSPADALFASDIAAWGQQIGLDAVVWTALPPRFDGNEGRAPSAEEALSYLRGLRGEALAHAREYVERVPDEIRTAYRARIESELGWRSAHGALSPADGSA